LVGACVALKLSQRLAAAQDSGGMLRAAPASPALAILMAREYNSSAQRDFFSN